MPVNIIEAIQARVSDEHVRSVAASTGESPTRMRRAVIPGILALVAGLVRRAGTREGASGMLATMQAGDSGLALLGPHTDGVRDTLVHSSGLSTRSAGGLLAALGPIAGGVLLGEVRARRLDANGLASLLREQRRQILARSDLPLGLEPMLSGLGGTGRSLDRPAMTQRDVSVAALPGFHVEELDERDPRGTRHVAGPARRGPARTGVLGTVLALLALAAVFFVGLDYIRDRGHTTTVIAPMTVPMEEEPIAGVPTEPETPDLPAVPPLPPATETSPAGTTTLSSGEMERGRSDTAGASDLAAHFAASAPLPETFTLPGVTFAVGSAALAGDDREPIKELADQLATHPKARVRVEGHADATGSQDGNTELSKKRALAVKRKLVQQGVAPGRIETVGRRDAEPVGSNETEEGRRANRRVDIVLLAR